MTSVIKIFLILFFIVFALAVINPIKACYVVNTLSSYSYQVTSIVGNFIINLALIVRGV